MHRTDLIEIDTVPGLPALFRERVRRTPDAVAYRSFDATRGRWVDFTWQEMEARIARWRAALERERLARGESVAVMLPNGPDWVCFDQAALGLGLVVVPLFVNDRPDNLAYMLSRSCSRLLLLDGAEQWQGLAPALGGSDGLRVVSRERIAGAPQVEALADWLTERASESPPIEVGRQDPATIVFTSGTIGRPKGVVLSHGNILWNARASWESNPVMASDLMLSFLPLSHMFERTLGYYLPIMAGATVAYARSVAQLGEDLPAIRPTVLISVPRIYERVHARIQAQMETRPAWARRLFRAAVAVGWQRFEHRQGRAGWRPALMAWPLLKRLVANKVMARLGGRIRLAVCGGAPLPAEVARTFIGLGLPLVQGYGMTELSPVVSGNSLRDNDPASVGRPLRGVELDIAPSGELRVRGPGVMQGYLDDVEATARAIDRDGWLHTGDKAEIREGRLYITGRLKDILVLSNGEKVPPADMEIAIVRDPLFEQAMILGEGRPYLGALVVLNPERWRELAIRLELDPDEPSTLASARLNDELCVRIAAQLREFPGYAQVRRVAALLEPWTVEEGLLTPTLKLRRAAVTARHHQACSRLYAGH